MDPRLSIAFGVGALITAVLWGVALALHRVDRAVTVRGLRNGALVGCALFAITFVLETLLFDAPLGLLVGLMVGGAYLWLGTTLIPIGLLFSSKPAWTTVGAWAAVPVIVMSAGFGYAAYRGVNQETTAAASTNATVSLALSGARLGNVNISGAAACHFDSRGALSIDAGAGSGASSVSTADGRPVTIGYAMSAEGANPTISVSIGPITAVPGVGWTPSPQTMAVSPGSSTRAGQVTLSDIVPLGVSGEPDRTERWSGTFSWTCSG